MCNLFAHGILMIFTALLRNMKRDVIFGHPIFSKPFLGRSWVLLMVVVAVAGLVSCEKLKLEDGVFRRICTWDVPTGLHYKFRDAPGGPEVVDFLARAYHLTQDSNCRAFDDERHPLVVIAHGRISSGVPNNYKGMSFLAHHLNSWGDIVVSVNLDVVNALQGAETQWGIPHRGELVLHTIEYMLAENRKPGSPFFQRIDSTRIALVGHSRGGGAVIWAANNNQNFRNRPIKAVATLSPANFGTNPLEVAVPHLCLYGSWDGDLYEGEGPDLWARGARLAPRELVEIYGANHYYFTDGAYFPPESQELSREEHQYLARGFVNAWLDRFLRDHDPARWEPYLMGQKRFGQWLEYYVSYQSADFLPVRSSGQSGERVMMGSAVSVMVQPFGLCDFKDVDLSGKPNYCVGTGIKAAWDANADRLGYKFNPLDASRFGYLSFRACQVHGDSLNRVDFKKDFHVEMVDAQGHRDRLKLADYVGGLQYPDLSGSLPADDPYNRKQIMRGYRIPLKDFQNVNLRSVSGLEFCFDRKDVKGFDNVSGAIKVTDVEFSN